MLTLYRRHTTACGNPNRYWKRCQCPMWVEGTLDRQYMRKSLHTQSWERARAVVDDWERQGLPKVRPDVPTIADAHSKYLADCRINGFAPLTLTSHTRWLKVFADWCQENNYQTVDELDTDAVASWISELVNQVESTTKQSTRMRLAALFDFYIRRKWMTENPVHGLSKLIVKQTPTDYVTKEERAQLFDAIKDPETLALALLMRWSGLRITDAVTLEKHRIDRNDLLFLYAAKTGTPVQVLLPKVCVTALKALPVISARYYFIKEDEDAYNVGRRHRRNLAEAGREAKLTKHVHPHMLRDTFAIELLLAGVPLDQVSILLGHKSIKTTEKHYAPFVKARQEQLNQSVRLAWG